MVQSSQSGNHSYTPIAYFATVDHNDIKQILNKNTQQISDEFKMSKSLARAILIKNGWDVELAKSALSMSTNYIHETFNFTLLDEE